MGRKFSAVFFKSFHLKSLDKHLEDFLKKVQFFHHFWTLSSKIYPTFAENLPQAWQKCIIGVKGNILRKNNLSEKNTCFSDRFWTSSQFFLGNSTKIFRQGCQTSYFIFCVYRGRVRAKIVFGKKTFSLMFVTLVTKKLGGGDSPGEHFETFFEKLIVFITVYVLWSKTFRKFFECFRFWPRNFDGVV